MLINFCMQKSSVELLHGQIFFSSMFNLNKMKTNILRKKNENGFKLKSTFPTDKYKT